MDKDLIILTINRIIVLSLERGITFFTLVINGLTFNIDSYNIYDDFLYLRWQGSTVAIIHINDIYSIS